MTTVTLCTPAGEPQVRGPRAEILALVRRLWPAAALAQLEPDRDQLVYAAHSARLPVARLVRR